MLWGLDFIPAVTEASFLLAEGFKADNLIYNLKRSLGWHVENG